MATWKELIESEMSEHGDSFDNVVAVAFSNHEAYDDENPDLSITESNWLNREFDDGYGGTEGFPFTVWTETRVYFPTQYDGAEWVGSVSRIPDGKPNRHFGGG